MAKLSMDWIGDLNFRSGEPGPPLDLFSSSSEAPSPTQALAYATMACMAMDVVHVLTKGRCDFRGLRVSFDGERAAEPPRRWVLMKLHFDVTGDVSEERVERAIKLSREKYCSVSNTLDPNLDLRTSFAIHKPDQP
jgi:putative redox protein